MAKAEPTPLPAAVSYSQKGFPLQRNVAGLRDGRFDLLVVGGGIYGAWTAADAAARGLRVALIERDDWGAGTSSASSKLIHGGLRYLEHFEFALVRHALSERRVLTQLAPHLVRPLRFMLPVYSDARVGRFKLGAGLALYDLLSGFKQPVARHRRYSPQALRTRLPFLAAEGLRGGFSYGDCQEDDARMTLSVVAAAQAYGAVCANRVAAVELREDTTGAVCGVSAHDQRSGETLHIDARVVVAATGPWSRQLLGQRAPAMKLVKGVHLLLPPLPHSHDAFLLDAPQDGRVFFVIPWYGRTLVGTTEAEIQSPSEAVVLESERRYLLDAVRARLPGLGWQDHDVIAAFAGARTLQAEDAANLSAVTREFELLEPRPQLLLPLGGKYTTARSDAIGIVDRVQALLGQERKPSTTHRSPLPGAPQLPIRHWLAQMLPRLLAAGLDAETAGFAALRHGTQIERALDYLQENPAWAQRLHPAAPFAQVEAVLAIRDEMALSIEDLLRRRIPLHLLVSASDLQSAGTESQLETMLAELR